MGYQLVGIVVIIAWVSLIAIPTFLIMRKLHVLRVDKAVEALGLDVAELGTVSEEFIDSVREHIEAKEKATLKLKEIENAHKVKVIEIEKNDLNDESEKKHLV